MTPVKEPVVEQPAVSLNPLGIKPGGMSLHDDYSEGHKTATDRARVCDSEQEPPPAHLLVPSSGNININIPATLPPRSDLERVRTTERSAGALELDRAGQKRRRAARPASSAAPA